MGVIVSENRSKAFLSETVSIKRWRLYSVQFTGLCLGWLAIQNIFEASRHTLLMAFLFAFAVCAFNYWSDLRRAEIRRAENDSRR